MRLYSPKSLTAATIALSIFMMPALAMADGSTIQLKPLQNTNGYTNTYNSNGYNNGVSANGSNNAYNSNGYGNNYGYDASTTGTPAYGSSYYSPTNTDTTLQARLSSVPKGTMLSIHTDQPINSYGAHIGDPINATLENDVYINDAVAIPAGSQVLGQVANVSSAAHLGKHGEIDVRFDSIKLSDGHVIPLHAHIVTKDQSGVLKGDTYAMDVTKGVGISAGSAGVGTLMGTAAGSLLGSVGTGAVFGLGVGALGGMGYALARKGKDVVIPAGSRMSVVVDAPVAVSN